METVKIKPKSRVRGVAKLLLAAGQRVGHPAAEPSGVAGVDVEEVT